MAEEKKLGVYLEEYSSAMLQKLGSNFSYDSFIDKSHKGQIRADGLIASDFEEVINFPWL